MKYLILVTFILITAIVISQVLISRSTSNTETVNYEVLSKKNGFEIRSYPELTVASTDLHIGSYADNSRIGFRRIASYIFGGNSSNKQIAMTSPVQMDMDEQATMSFYMPTSIQFNELPTPNRQDVIISKEPAKIVAALEFSGWASDEVLEEKFAELKKLLVAENIEFEDSYSYLGYNPPYQMVNRRNEVLIKLIKLINY